MDTENNWQRQLLGAALMAAAKTAIDYLTKPESRDQTVGDVRARFAEVDYEALAKALTRSIDQFTTSSKSALNEAIDQLRESADDVVEAAAEKAQEQLGKKKRKRGRLFLGILLGAGLAYYFMDEDRRNQMLDKLTGASGPVDTAQSWSSTASQAATNTASQASQSAQTTMTQAQQAAQTTAATAADQATQTIDVAKSEANKTADTAQDQATSASQPVTDTTP